MMNAAQANYSVVLALLLIVPVFVALVLMAIFALLFGTWIRGFASGVPVSVVQILGMRLRGVPPRLIVDALVTLVHRGRPFDRAMIYHAQSLFLAQRGLIRSPEHLADMVEKQLKAS